ncbi:MAG: hypothetical protein GX548_09140 [Lentisphaerae bacterium]|nr:hypothetical protein [Lentisphaerota bacterium]
MERAEFATGSIEVRGSRTIHRILSFLGAFFLGIGPEAERGKKSENWWDCEDAPVSGGEPVTLTFGRQTELFDDAGQAVFTPAEPSAEAPVSAPPAVASRVLPQTRVSVRSPSKTSSRVVVTRRAPAVTRVAAVPKTAGATRGAVARQLILSQSISSGREDSRWFSVPQRVLLPRYQLFEGSDGVSEDPGGLRVGGRSMRTQRGHVWFV